ncbi:MAG: RNA methyltransferase [Coxiellaceae bacterium]|jgi:TrmH family RNA methyltransferase|nr:RNA methyltransferase [Coxiellaceae bacterium]
MPNNIRIVLVNPSHPGNIGAVARAMKTMELKELYIVNPKDFPNANATAMAAGADDILAAAIITQSLPEALHNIHIVFGASARLRSLQLPTFDPKTAANTIINNTKTHNIAILFGRESNGLSNEELEMCNYHIHIPTNPNFSSLNIASAVQLIVYEIKIANQINTNIDTHQIALADTNEIQSFYQHLQQTLLAIRFLYPDNQKSIMAKLKRLFNRTRLEKTEINIFRGILTAINIAIKKKNE